MSLNSIIPFSLKKKLVESVVKSGSFFGFVNDNPNSVTSIIQFQKFQEWQKSHVKNVPVFQDRFSLYDYLQKGFIKNQPISYLEFGVYKGETIKYWSELNDNTNSTFDGFDTFTGLPEDWAENKELIMSKGTFSTDGQVPQIDDKRVSFYPGLFQDTLSDFLKVFPKSDNTLVLHNDSDIYSATLYTLAQCNEILKPGSILIFDEFCSVFNEFEAFLNYTSAYMRDKYEVLAITKDLVQVAIRFK